jgi:transcriptional regulator with XRE-family HTH domain
MAYDFKQFSKMISDSGLKIKDIQKKTGISKQAFYELRQPENAHRITTDKVMKVAKVIGVNPIKYFPEMEDDVVTMLEEPMEVYQASKTNKKVQEYFEDIMLELVRYRDEYVKSLQYNISLQEKMISMLSEKSSPDQLV